MADSTPTIGPNFRDVVIKAGALRLSDTATRDTTDYAEIIVGDGAPSGAYGRHSGATMVYLRKDASTAATAVYVTVDGGTTWTAIATGSTPTDPELAAIAGLTSAADKGIMFTGSGTAAVYTLTAAGLALLDDAAASNQRTTLGLAIGTDVQAYDAGLTSLVSADAAAGLPYVTGANTWASLAGFSPNDLVRATVACANATGGATTALMSVQLYRMDGTTAINAARQVQLMIASTQYIDAAGPTNASLTLGTVTAGSIISATVVGSVYLIETDATGLFACTATNTDDETVYLSVKSADGGVSDVAKSCLVIGSNSDSAAWSA